jgi:adenine-specific DNA methylase
MSEQKRLIEVAFPLKQASLDSVHEKNVRHGHVSTLHIWPARRPLAAARAALVATLLPDPGDNETRAELLKRLGGEVKETWKSSKSDSGSEEKRVTYTSGGILHWGRETSPDLAWFRDKIREAYGGRPPRVLDPFAGGGAIPLEAMRLGCEVTAVDINPVAWFILKCTLEYPQELAGKTRPLPDFALKSAEFMEAFKKGTGKGKGEGKAKGSRKTAKSGEIQGEFFAAPEADLAWHVRAWGLWVLERAGRDVAPYYPVVEDKPTVAYLWARTVTCKHCRAKLPLLKTRWLCKKGNKRVLLTVTPNTAKSGVAFDIQAGVPQANGSSATRKAHDKQLGAGTMSRAGATCPCCGLIMTSEDIRLEGQAGRLGEVMTAVVVDGKRGKEYRLPTEVECRAAEITSDQVDALFSQIPFGVPDEPVPQGGSRTGGGSPFTVHIYGMNNWRKLFTERQLWALGTFVKYTLALDEQLRACGYPPEWQEAIQVYLACAVSRMTDRASTICHWSMGYEKIQNTFSRFALPISWDFAEGNQTALTSGGYPGHINWIAKVIQHCSEATENAPSSTLVRGSALSTQLESSYDVVLTDPPYYDAIP